MGYPLHDNIGSFGSIPAVVSPMTWTHRPIGVPRGIVVNIVGNTDVDTVAAVTYGGVPMSRVQFRNVSGEKGSAYTYFLGISVPVGPQAVVVSFVGSDKHCGVSSSLTAANDTFVDVQDGVSSLSLANPFITLAPTADGWLYGCIFSGVQSVNKIKPNGGYFTSQEVDFGPNVASFIRATGAVAVVNGPYTPGWQVSADDVAAVALLVGEVL